MLWPNLEAAPRSSPDQLHQGSFAAGTPRSRTPCIRKKRHRVLFSEFRPGSGFSKQPSEPVTSRQVQLPCRVYVRYESRVAGKAGQLPNYQR